MHKTQRCQAVWPWDCRGLQEKPLNVAVPKQARAGPRQQLPRRTQPRALPQDPLAEASWAFTFSKSSPQGAALFLASAVLHSGLALNSELTPVKTCVTYKINMTLRWARRPGLLVPGPEARILVAQW